MEPGDDPKTCQPVPAPSPCDDAGCEETCEVQDGAAVCTCPEGMEPGDDPKTCQPIVGK